MRPRTVRRAAASETGRRREILRIAGVHRRDSAARHPQIVRAAQASRFRRHIRTARRGRVRQIAERRLAQTPVSATIARQRRTGAAPMKLLLARMRRRAIDRTTRTRLPTIAVAVVRIQRPAAATRRRPAPLRRVTQRLRGHTRRLAATTRRLRALTPHRAARTPRLAAVTAEAELAIAVAAEAPAIAAVGAVVRTVAVEAHTPAVAARTAAVTKNIQGQPAPGSGAGFFVVPRLVTTTLDARKCLMWRVRSGLFQLGIGKKPDRASLGIQSILVASALRPLGSIPAARSAVQDNKTPRQVQERIWI